MNKIGTSLLESGYVDGTENRSNNSCLDCSFSYSEELNDGENVLRCAVHEWEPVEDNGVCRQYH